MFDVIAAVNDQSVLKANLLRSPILAHPDTAVFFREGFASAALAYNSAFGQGHNPYVIYVHQDVYLPRGWNTRVAACISDLNAHDPDWAVLGLYGVRRSGQQVGYVWSSGLNQVLGHEFKDPQSVESIDELLLVTRRSAALEFDEGLPGYHLFGTDLVQSAQQRGMTAYVICAPVIHNSRPVLYLQSDYIAAYRYLVRKWNARLPIQNCITPLVRSPFALARMHAKRVLGSARYAGTNRSRFDRRFDAQLLAKKLNFES